MKPTEKQKQEFKKLVKSAGLGSINYDSLELWQKQIYNGIKSANKKKIRVSGRFIAAQFERKINKTAKNAEISTDSKAFKNIVKKAYDSWVEYKMNDQKTLDNIEEANQVYFNDRPVKKALAAQTINRIMQVLREKNAVGCIFKVYKNEAGKKINIILPRK